MNHVLILARNNLSLTQRAITSVWTQDVPTKVSVIDNDSSDGTAGWLTQAGVNHKTFSPQLGVSAGWNWGLDRLFNKNDHVLVINNDVELPRWFYSELLGYMHDAPFVTGVAIDDHAIVDSKFPPTPMPLSENPDFSAFLIFRSAWEEIGPFDESMKFYSSDQDYHLRGWFKGVRMAKANVPYYHETSSTLRLASPEEREAIQRQADQDRGVLRDKWGVSAGGPDYEKMFSPESFGCRKLPQPSNRTTET
jgi:GT2 family glycosyltransferase